MHERLVGWLPVLLAATGIATFVGTVLPYLNAGRDGKPSWLPMIFGLAVFAGLACYCTYLVRGRRSRWWEIAISGAVAALAFIYAFFFLLLNSVGA